MKKILLSISLLALAYTASANVPVIKSDPKIEAQVEQTLKKLTLEEKIGQMMELVTDLFGGNDKNGVFYIDEHKTDSILSRYKIGSILNAPNTCAPTAKQWEKYIAQIQKISMKRIGIPCVFGLDQNHGSTYTQGGTLFPQNINVAATFNREIARRLLRAISCLNLRLDFAFSTSYLRNISALYYWNVYHKQGMIYGRMGSRSRAIY